MCADMSFVTFVHSATDNWNTFVCMCCFVLLNRYWGIVMYGPGASSLRRCVSVKTLYPVLLHARWQRLWCRARGTYRASVFLYNPQAHAHSHLHTYTYDSLSHPPTITHVPVHAHARARHTYRWETKHNPMADKNPAQESLREQLRHEHQASNLKMEMKSAKEIGLLFTVCCLDHDHWSS